MPLAYAQSTTTDDANTTAQNDKDQTVKLEKMEVTGSRIPRLDTESVSPVLSISAESIKDTGFTSIGDALRSLPFNSGQALTPTDSGTSFTPGISTINLRGLGNNSTLVLINGRRAVPYAAPGFNGLQTMFDLESIPDAAIDRVEILKDGGSAIYGSDAVGGVVNFVLKKDYTGLTTRMEVGNYGNVNALYKQFDIVAGAQTGKTSLFVAANWKEQEPVYARELPYSANADQTSRASQADPHWIWDWQAIDWPNEMGMPTPANEADAWAAVANWFPDNPIDYGWYNLNSSRGFPGYVTVPGVGRRTFSAPTNSPTTAAATSTRNMYNYQQTAGLFPTTRKYAIFTRMQYDFSYKLYAFAELGFTRTETQSDAAPTPVDIETSIGLSPGTQLTIPSYNAYNPWHVDITNGRRRLVENGNRINDVTSDTPRLLAGLHGTIEGVPVLDGWQWETGVMYSKNTVTNLNAGSVPDSRMQQALMGLTRNGDGSLSWDPTTPIANRVYYNWFGINEKAFVDFLNTDNPNVATLEYTNIDVSAGGDLVEFKDGKIGMSVGAEHRTEKLADVKTLLNATGNILGGSEGTSSYGDRTVDSVYAEAEISMFKKLLEIQVAGRFEKYSDKGFEQKVRPKFGLKLRPTNWLLLRGSYSQAFKAPDLSYLYAASSTSFTSGNVYDPVTQTTINQLQIVTAGNPTLRPETTDVYYAGLTVDAPGVLKGLQVDIDWFRYKQKDLLAQLSDFYGYNSFLSEAAAGNPLFSDKVVRDSATNQVLYIKDFYANISEGKYQGIDYSVSYKWNTDSMGQFRVGAAATWLDKLEIDGNDIVGGYLTAKWNATGTFTWKYRDWRLNLYEIYRGKRVNEYSLGTLFTNNDEILISYRIKPQYLTNVALTYSGFSNMDVTLGVNNAFNSEPPEDPENQTGATTGISNLEPLFWFLRVEKSF